MSSKERKEWRKTWVALPVDRCAPTPSHEKLARKFAHGAPLKFFLKRERHLARIAVFLVRQFSKWRSEAPEALRDNEWPDRGSFETVTTDYSTVVAAIRQRGHPKFQPVIIIPPWVQAEAALT